MEAQRKTVIAHNPRTSTFEYIGEPLALKKDAALKTVEDIITAMKDWLARPTNDRLSIQQIFESLDIENCGELNTKNFESALSRLGIQAKQGELQLLKEVLDQRHVGYLHYRSLVRELQGVPQLDFMNKAVIKLAKIAEGRDLSLTKFLSLIDPKNEGSMSEDAFRRSIAQCAAPDFHLEETAVTSLFKHVTKAEHRLTGVTLSIQQLATKVFQGVKAILVDQVRVAFEKAGLSMSQLFEKYDSNKDGLLDHAELLKALSDCHLTLKSKMSDVLLKEVFGAGGGERSAAGGKISYGTLKFYLESGGPLAAEGSMLARSRDQIDSKSGAGPRLSDSMSSAAGLTADMLQMCKRAARKVLAQCHSNIVEIVGKLDHLEEGIVNKEELK